LFLQQIDQLRQMQRFMFQHIGQGLIRGLFDRHARLPLVVPPYLATRSCTLCSSRSATTSLSTRNSPRRMASLIASTRAGSYTPLVLSFISRANCSATPDSWTVAPPPAGCAAGLAPPVA